MASTGVNIYLRVKPGVIKDLRHIFGERSITVKDKSAMAIVLEDVLEWAVAVAAHGKEAEAEIERRRNREALLNGQLSAEDIARIIRGRRKENE